MSQTAASVRMRQRPPCSFCSSIVLACFFMVLVALHKTWKGCTLGTSSCQSHVSPECVTHRKHLTQPRWERRQEDKHTMYTSQPSGELTDPKDPVLLFPCALLSGVPGSIEACAQSSHKRTPKLLLLVQTRQFPAPVIYKWQESLLAAWGHGHDNSGGPNHQLPSQAWPGCHGDTPREDNLIIHPKMLLPFLSWAAQWLDGERWSLTLPALFPCLWSICSFIPDRTQGVLQGDAYIYILS